MKNLKFVGLLLLSSNLQLFAASSLGPQVVVENLSDLTNRPAAYREVVTVLNLSSNVPFSKPVVYRHRPDLSTSLHNPPVYARERSLTNGVWQADLLASPSFNAKDFGARGDGSTDDTTALNLLATSARLYFKQIYIPVPTNYYRTSNTLDFTDLGGIDGTDAEIRIVGGPLTAVMIGSDATTFGNANISLKLRDALAGTSQSPLSIGAKIKSINNSRVSLNTRGFYQGWYFDGTTMDRVFVANQFDVVSSYNDAILAHFDLDGSSYATHNVFSGQTYLNGVGVIYTNGVAPFKLTSRDNSIMADTMVRDITFNLFGDSWNTNKQAAFVYADVTSTFLSNTTIDFDNCRFEGYGTLSTSGSITPVFVEVTTNSTSRVGVGMYFYGENSPYDWSVRVPDFNRSKIRVSDMSSRGLTFGSPQIIVPTPTIPYSISNTTYVPNRTLFNSVAGYNVPTNVLSNPVSSGYRTAIGDGEFTSADTAQTFGLYYTKTTNYALHAELFVPQQFTIICYDINGNVLGGTTPSYAQGEYGRATSVSGTGGSVNVYQFDGRWFWLHRSVAKFFIGPTAWTTPNVLKDIAFKVMAGGVLVQRNDVFKSASTFYTPDTYPRQSFFPVGTIFASGSATNSGWISTFYATTTVVGNHAPSVGTLTIASTNGVVAGDVIGIGVDNTPAIGLSNYVYNTVASVGSNFVTLVYGLQTNTSTGRPVFFNRWAPITASGQGTVRVVSQDINATATPIDMAGNAIVNYLFTGAATNAGTRSYTLPTNNVPTGANLTVTIVGTNTHTYLPLYYEFIASGVTNYLYDSNRIDYVYTGSQWVKKPTPDFTHGLPDGLHYGWFNGAPAQTPLQSDASADSTPWVRYNATWKRLVAGANVTFTVGSDITVSATGGGGGGPTNGSQIFVEGSLISSANAVDSSTINTGISGTNWTWDVINGSLGTNKLSSVAISYFLDRGNHTGTQPSSTISDLTATIWDKIKLMVVPGTNVNFVTNNGAQTLTVSATATGSGGGSSGYTNEVLRRIGWARFGQRLDALTLGKYTNTLINLQVSGVVSDVYFTHADDATSSSVDWARANFYFTGVTNTNYVAVWTPATKPDHLLVTNSYYNSEYPRLLDGSKSLTNSTYVISSSPTVINYGSTLETNYWEVAFMQPVDVQIPSGGGGSGGIGGITINGSGQSSNAVSGTMIKFTQSGGDFSDYPTNLSADLFTSGTIDVSRLPSSVLLESEAAAWYASLTGNNSFSGNQTFGGTVSFNGSLNVATNNSTNLFVNGTNILTLIGASSGKVFVDGNPITNLNIVSSADITNTITAFTNNTLTLRDTGVTAGIKNGDITVDAKGRITAAKRWKYFQRWDLMAPISSRAVAMYPDMAGASVGSGGTVSAVSGETNHFGIFRLTSGSVSNTGYNYITETAPIVGGAGGEYMRVAWRPVLTNGNTFIFGFLDAVSNNILDGMTFRMGYTPSTYGRVEGVASVNGAATTTAGNTNVVQNTWVQAWISNSIPSGTLTVVLEDESGTRLWSDVITNGLPTSNVRQYGYGITMLNTNTSSACLDLDFVEVGIAE